MINERANAYSEINVILDMIHPRYRDKIPKKLRKLFFDEMNKNYKPQIRADIPLKHQKINKKTFTILAMLNLNYWCDSPEHKEELIELYNKNEKFRQEKIREKYNPDNIFKNKDITAETINTTMEMIEYKETIFERILNIIKSIFMK